MFSKHFTFLPWIPGCWRPLIIRNMVLIKYALLITRVLLYALQGTIWSLLEVSFSIWHFLMWFIVTTITSAVLTSFSSCVPESLRYLSMYDNRCLRYFKGHKQRFEHAFVVNEYSSLQKGFCLISIFSLIIIVSFPFCFGAFLISDSKSKTHSCVV